MTPQLSNSTETQIANAHFPIIWGWRNLINIKGLAHFQNSSAQLKIA
jgi:hypothetical protein